MNCGQNYSFLSYCNGDGKEQMENIQGEVGQEGQKGI